MKIPAPMNAAASQLTSLACHACGQDREKNCTNAIIMNSVEIFLRIPARGGGRDLHRRARI
ncbi:hypothetical protein [Cupriavidus sp. DF5525]|uniref:hypothetical protein n=1 Tax=Cupriavidus sp. DF5525 TaxID=3160989 RepID=UPI0032DEF75E